MNAYPEAFNDFKLAMKVCCNSLLYSACLVQLARIAGGYKCMPNVCIMSLQATHVWIMVFKVQCG